MTAESIPTTRFTSQWSLRRWGLLAALVLCEILVASVLRSQRAATDLLLVVEFVGVAAVAGALAYASARSFDAGQTARRAWLFIALMPLGDALTLMSYIIPNLLGKSESKGPLVAAATTVISLSRILVAVAFFMMIRVYRKSGLSLKLQVRDYAAMIVLGAMGVGAALMSNVISWSTGGERLHRIAFFFGTPMIIALIPCSIFGVILWRYAACMGGGLVAKAWRNVLLYGVVWVTYLLTTGLTTYIPRPIPSEYFFVFYVIRWLLIGSQYFIFLGASYQYEACNSALEFE